MAKIYYDKDCDLSLLQGKIVGIIGYGAQGHAHAQNLRDSGVKVIVGEAEGTPGWKKAADAGFEVLNAEQAAKKADIVVVLIPDHLQARVYRENIQKGMTAGKLLMFAHGFNIHYGQIVPPSNVDVAMVAPKCPGAMVRQLYIEKAGPPAIVAVEVDASGKAKEIALAYAKGIGCSRAGVIETTFAEETETDLFGEQAVLCGGVTALMKTAFEVLVESGYQPEIAYFEVCNELKLIVDLIYQGGFVYMRECVSDTAEYGDYTRGPRVINDDVRAEMEEILCEVQDGTFAKEWITENMANRPVYNSLKKMEKEHLIEEVGAELRAMMNWLPKKK